MAGCRSADSWWKEYTKVSQCFVNLKLDLAKNSFNVIIQKKCNISNKRTLKEMYLESYKIVGMKANTGSLDFRHHLSCFLPESKQCSLQKKKR